MTLRLLKVIVQPVYVEDDGDTFGDQFVADPVSVVARDWPDYPATLARVEVLPPSDPESDPSGE